MQNVIKEKFIASAATFWICFLLKMFKFIVLVCLAAVSYGASLPETNVTIEEYIVGGRDTDISEIPYQVAMYKGGRFMCGGSIVAPTMIVTAAHCVQSQQASQITFRAGSSSPTESGVMIDAKKLYLHPSYDSNTMDYDVAVVELESPLTYSSTIKPIKLATSEPSDGAQVKTSGWGALKENGPLAKTLQSVIIPVINKRTCASYLAEYLKVTPRMICAGVKGKDSCQGDSGGPLNANGQLAGVVSCGVGCARKNLPGVYTSVADPDITAFIRKYARI